MYRLVESSVHVQAWEKGIEDQKQPFFFKDENNYFLPFVAHYFPYLVNLDAIRDETSIL